MSSNELVTTVLLAAGAYVLGSVPFGLLVGKARGVDIRTVGSKNIGATNVGRTVGRPWGILVFFLDMLKGLLPTLGTALMLASANDTSEATRNLCVLGVGVLAVLGHNCSVFLRFTGGKGVATSLGVALGVYPDMTIAALAAFGVWLLVTLISRYVSLGSICAAVSLPVVLVVRSRGDAGFLTDDWPLLACGVLLAAMIIYRHRQNIVRIARGTEGKIGGSHNMPKTG